MDFPLKDSEKETDVSRVLFTVTSSVLLVTATVLLLFVYLRLPVATASAVALGAFFAGSLLAWRNFAFAQGILLVSLLVSEFVLFNYAEVLLVPFIALDLVALYFVVRTKNTD